MIDRSEIRDFFQNEIEPSLDNMNSSIKSEKISLIGFLVIFVLMSVLLKFSDNFSKMTLFLLFVGGMFFVYYLILRINESSEDLDSIYENIVIKPLVKKVLPSFKYHKTKGFNNIEFSKSHLFTGYDKYKSNRVFSGYLDGSYIKFANIQLTKGKGREKVSIFNGLFISTKMKKSINGRVVVHPDDIEKRFGILGRDIQGSKLNGLERVLLDSPEFEREFVVYADDKVEANYILTHSMMERLIKFFSQLDKDYNKLYISFVGDSIYMAIDNFGFLDREAVMLSTRSSYIDFEQIELFLDTFELVLGLSKDLNLGSTV